MPNLILVHQKTKQDPEDYREIARLVEDSGQGISVFIVDTKDRSPSVAGMDETQSTLTVSPMPLKQFRPPRGTVLQGFEYPKGEQYEMLSAVAMPVPEWIRITPDTKLDPEAWGPYVVVKPELGRKGAEIFIKRTGRVRYRAPEEFDEDHPGRKASMLAQRFIYTGRWPSNFRVVTLFGKALMCWLCEADHSHVPLNSRFDFKAKGGITVVSNKRTSSYSLSFDEGVIALAEACHRAFPDQPVLGTDIVRDSDTGELYVLECNPRGDAWLLSSDMGRMIEQANGLDFKSQFDGLKIAASVLAEVTLARAS